MKLYLHAFNKDTPSVLDTIVFQFSKPEGTFQDLFAEIQKIVPQGLKLNSLAPSYKAKAFDNLLLSVSTVLKENDDLFVELEKPTTKVLTEAELSEMFFEPLTKYKFYENDENNVRVVLELKAIDKHPAEKIVARFLDRSFEVKILAYNGKNYNFAVPKLQCKINPTKSKYWVKGDKLIINLYKNKKEDNWYSLYRTKAIGDDDD